MVAFSPIGSSFGRWCVGLGIASTSAFGPHGTVATGERAFEQSALAALRPASYPPADCSFRSPKPFPSPPPDTAIPKLA